MQLHLLKYLLYVRRKAVQLAQEEVQSDDKLSEKRMIPQKKLLENVDPADKVIFAFHLRVIK